MSNLSDIKRRIASVKQTRQITGAMETVSVAKMRKAIDKLEFNRVYFKTLCDIMRSVEQSATDDGDDCRAKSGNGKNMLIVFSSDRGLCGGFDHDIFRFAEKLCDEHTVIVPIGQTAGGYYKTRANADMRLVDFYKPEYSVAERIAEQLIEMYENGAQSVTLVYSELLSRSTYGPTALQLLPVITETDKSNRACSIDLFEPSKSDIKKIITPMYVAGAVYGALLNNVAAEHCARHAAMSAATESADEVISRLSVEYNRARQSAVTEQIVEIIGSTAALKKQGAVNEKRP